MVVFLSGKRYNFAAYKGDNMDKYIITDKILGCAIEVHRNLGPGLLESAYEECL